MKTKFLFVIILCMLFSAAFAVNSANLNIKNSNNLKDIFTPSLGGGYSSDMQSSRLSCLNGNGYKLDGGSKSVMALGKAYDFNQI